MKIKNLRLKITYLFIGLLGYLFIAQAINANSLSLSLDPPIIEIKAIPPANVTSSLNIQNKSDTEIALQIQLKPFKAKGENGELQYSKEALDIVKNIQILDAGASVENITLGPQQQKTLDLNINIPQDTNISARPPATSLDQSQINQTGVAGEGGRDYYFSVVFISTRSSPAESNSSVNQLGIATNVLLSVGETETPNASLEQFSSNIFLEKGPVPFTIRIRNEGSHFIKPKGEITIKNMFGQTIGRLDLINANILSDSIRAIPNKDSIDFKQPIVLWKENFLLGLYSATLNISMSNEGPVFTKTIRFIAFPFETIIILIATLITIIIIRNKLTRYANKNRI